MIRGKEKSLTLGLYDEAIWSLWGICPKDALSKNQFLFRIIRFLVAMRNSFLLVCLLALLTAGFSAKAQIRAYTEDGISVVLYPDGTWESSRDPFFGKRRPRGMYPIDPQESRVDIEKGSDLKSCRIMIRGEIIFTLRNGFLDNVTLLDEWGNAIYDQKTGETAYLPGREVLYDRDRIIRYGKFDFKYSFHDDKLEKIGPYDIKYIFADDRVSKIGSYNIEYDFFTDTIKRIGNVCLELDSFRERLKRVTGSNPGVVITFF